MNCIAKILPCLFLLTTALTAQTTGVPWVNDLTVRLPPTFTAQGSGTASCNYLGVIPSSPPPGAIYELTAVGPTAVVLMLGFVGCTPAGIGFTPAAAPSCAGPVAGTPLTNLWFSLNFGGGSPFPVVGQPNSAGMTQWSFKLPGSGFTMWAQAVMLDTCSPTGFKFSQALGFTW